MSPTAAATLIVGLNGALQKRFVLPPNTPLIPGNVHRASQVQVGVGGKGQDVAVTLACLHYTPPLMLVQFIGSGAEGDVVYQMLHDLLVHNNNNNNNNNHDVSAMELTVRTNSAMRTCTSIVASDVTTELVEPSGLVTSAEWQELLEKLATKQADALCFMGSMPPGCPDDAYAKIYQIVARPHTLCLIDSVVGLGPLLEMIATIKEPSTSSSPTSHSTSTGSNTYSTMLKINASELCRLGNVKKRTDESGGVQRDELVAAVQALVRAYPAARAALHAIAITDGPHPAYFVVMPVSGENEMRLFQLPVAKLPLDLEEEDTEEFMTSSSAPAGGSGGGWGQWSESNASLEKMPDHHHHHHQQHPPPTPALSSKTTTTLYPIGAGDAVAAGTLGAWKALSHKPRQSASWQQPSTPPVGCLAPEIQQVLIGNESPGATSRARVMLTSFSFGLACGSASCLQEENSVLRVQDALDLYIREGRPMFLSSHMLPSS